MKKVFGWMVLGVFLTVSGVQAAAPAGHPVHKQAKRKIKKARKKIVKRKAAPRKVKNGK